MSIAEILIYLSCRQAEVKASNPDDPEAALIEDIIEYLVEL